MNSEAGMISKLVVDGLQRFGYTIQSEIPPDLPAEFLALHQRCKQYTMTPIERMYALHTAVRYIEENGISGDLVECGVWRGGSCMNIALSLMARGTTSRKLYLYDTYEGMSPPTPKDVSFQGTAAEIDYQGSASCYAGLDEVRNNLLSTGYPESSLHFIKGKVEDTIPATMPDHIALLRLDTDWYESTYHELTHLYPLLVPRGVLILDDYGHWKGAREATDRYFKEQGIYPLLCRIDYTGRMMIKL
jgi:O-methyltransferase